MKTSFFKSLLFLAALAFLFTACDEDDLNITDDTLYVKFENDVTSEYTITGIQILIMGEAGELDEPNGTFGSNLLESGVTIIPGGHTFFTLEIPSLHYAYYRLTVDDGTGTQILLYSQSGYNNLYEGTITHWGGDDRTVSVTIKQDPTTELIVVQGWSDWVGID